MRVAVVGCLHGSLSELYRTIPDVDLVLCCGDFQAFRNESDINSCHLPPKFRELGSFHEYYAQPRDIPLTIVVGGNHEASNYFAELLYGGWIAPNIYYLGVAGSVIVNGLRIAGASGIYKSSYFNLGHFEHVPLTGKSLHTIYNLKRYNEERLNLLPPVDIFLSHDWPVDITEYGDCEALLRALPRLQPSVDAGKLGAPPLSRVLQATRPRYWFAAHMHVKFPAVKVHPPKPDTVERQYEANPTPTEWLSAHALEPERVARQPATKQRTTRFLALSKPLPGKKDWWEILDIPAPSDASPPILNYDPAWLAITKASHPFPTNRNQPLLPDDSRTLPPSTLPADMRARVRAASSSLDDRASGPVSSVQVFAKTAPAEGEGTPAVHYINPQTSAFCAMLDIPDLTNPPPLDVSASPRQNSRNSGHSRGTGRGGGGRGGRGRGGHPNGNGHRTASRGEYGGVPAQINDGDGW